MWSRPLCTLCHVPSPEALCKQVLIVAQILTSAYTHHFDIALKPTSNKTVLISSTAVVPGRLYPLLPVLAWPGSGL